MVDSNPKPNNNKFVLQYNKDENKAGVDSLVQKLLDDAKISSPAGIKELSINGDDKIAFSSGDSSDQKNVLQEKEDIMMINKRKHKHTYSQISDSSAKPGVMNLGDLPTN